MITVDFWKIKKKGTIGLIGETNHSLIDTLLHIDNGLSDCSSFGGNPAMGYGTTNPVDVEYFTYAVLMDLADIGGNVRDGAHLA